MTVNQSGQQPGLGETQCARLALGMGGVFWAFQSFHMGDEQKVDVDVRL
jgi:hypothetical protein